MLIEKIPEMQLSTADDAEIAALLARCFDTDFGGRSYFSQRHHLRLVTRRHVIVCHIAMTLRAVQLGDQLVTIAGLAEVATDPSMRGQGIAGALLAEAITQAKSSPAEYLLLFGEAKLYSAAGFRTVANKMAHVATKGHRVARIVSDGDDALMTLVLRDQPWPATAPLDLRGPVF
ncbi:MAG: GNAT family N-acetyltransferase [Pseudorhodobacter sp.]|nr:GNAT family N-acetyltransferase [Pseudorhodobacter sp.]